jgi:hypothetical protein
MASEMGRPLAAVEAQVWKCVALDHFHIGVDVRYPPIG